MEDEEEGVEAGDEDDDDDDDDDGGVDDRDVIVGAKYSRGRTANDAGTMLRPSIMMRRDDAPAKGDGDGGGG
jgi:hypothetical protein